MTPAEVITAASRCLSEAGCVVDELRFSHAVFLPPWNPGADGHRETWLVYFAAINRPADSMTDSDWATVAVDDQTGQADRI